MLQLILNDDNDDDNCNDDVYSNNYLPLIYGD